MSVLVRPLAAKSQAGPTADGRTARRAVRSGGRTPAGLLNERCDSWWHTTGGQLSTIARLEVFRSVARHGSLTRAAKDLMYTTSAVSQNLSALERELGAPLFHRMPRGVTLTEPGNVLLAHVDKILDEYRSARQAVKRVNLGTGSLVRIGAFAEANATIVATAVARFRAAFPSVDISVRRVESEAALDLVVDRELDIAVVHEFCGEKLTVPAGVELAALMEDRFHVLLPQGHRFAGAREVALAELAEESWIHCTGKWTLDVLARATRPAGFAPRVVLQCDDETDLPGLAAAGVGVALTSSLSRSSLRSDVVVVPLAGDPVVRTLYTATASVPSTSVPVLAMQDLLGGAEDLLVRSSAG
ncbi:LysR substrate-binding domain-containing protein [Actinosynnema sp. NPDC050436]|uniref:LysR substrate-binding domain-containing protein n=1 Tax=Actinosynnema sp. NPDC050436 TaxID=3155659 RepID=UPI0033E19651